MRTPAARRSHLVVAIDGPAGAGKSTVAKGVARVLGIPHVDTGAMYRALTWLALERGISPSDGKALGALARSARLHFEPEGLRLNGRPVGREIRTPRVTAKVSEVSAHPGVRKALVSLQRKILERGPGVAEGRDIGTVVCPDAPVKVFLTATPGERARRRKEQLAEAGIRTGLQRLRQEIERRDSLDSSRKHSPLRPAPDALLLDSTTMTRRQVIDRVVGLAREAAGGAASPGGAKRAAPKPKKRAARRSAR